MPITKQIITEASARGSRLGMRWDWTWPADSGMTEKLPPGASPWATNKLSWKTRTPHGVPTQSCFHLRGTHESGLSQTVPRVEVDAWVCGAEASLVFGRGLTGRGGLRSVHRKRRCGCCPCPPPKGGPSGRWPRSGGWKSRFGARS